MFVGAYVSVSVCLVVCLSVCLLVSIFTFLLCRSKLNRAAKFFCGIFVFLTAESKYSYFNLCQKHETPSPKKNSRLVFTGTILTVILTSIFTSIFVHFSSQLAFRRRQPPPYFKKPHVPQWANLEKELLLKNVRHQRAEIKGVLLMQKRSFRRWLQVCFIFYCCFYFVTVRIN